MAVICSPLVDFELDDDELALQRAAGDLLDDLSSPARVRAAMESGDGYDRALWKSMVEQGWMGVELDEQRGGLGLGAVAAAVLLEQVGAHVAPAPFLPSLLALGALARAADDGVREAEPWVERLLTGDATGCVGWNGGLAVAAPIADVAIVADETQVTAVDLTEGGRPVGEPAMDRTRPLGWLRAGTGAFALGGRDAAATLLDRGATYVSAELLGGASRVLALTVTYAKERVQFGRPIGSFQAVKHRCADMLVDVEGMHSTAYHAAWCIGAGAAEASVASSTAKIWCSDASRRVMASGLQVHGGIGFTWEHDLHLYLKRAQLDQVTFGDAVYHRERLAGLLRDRLESGESIF
jgi:alkylation response protein AidB-like acyl-CoA dehydrogenase